MPPSQERLPDTVDGIIIGAGHNGLVVANYLARAGAKVLVLESQNHIGGGLTTEEITLPLFKHNLHAYFVRWTPNYRIWSDLQLSNYGMKTVVPEVQNAIPFRDGSALVSYHSVERSVEEFRRFSPRDAATYAERYAEFGEMVSRLVDPLRFAAPLAPDELESLLGRSELGRRYLALSRRSALELVLDLFESEPVRALVLFNVAVRAYLPVLDVPGTGYIVVLALFGSHHGAMIKGGSIAAPQALAASLYASGGRVLNRARVARIMVENNRAAGVELADGRRFMARHFVCTNVPAAITLRQMVEARHLDDALLGALADYRWNEEALFGVHLALQEPLRYGNAPADAPVNRALNYCVGYESSSDFVRDMEWIRNGTIPTDPAMHIASPTVFDPRQAPPGHATAFAWQFVPSRPAAGGPGIWDDGESAGIFATLMLKKWQEYAPNVAHAELARAVHSPSDTFRHVPSMVLGDRHLGSYHPDNFDSNRPHPLLASYRTPIEGLYLCGSDTYPGGSFTGQPGYNAATVIAQECGYDLWWHPQDPREVLPEA